jgi:hypothetical protein
VVLSAAQQLIRHVHAPAIHEEKAVGRELTARSLLWSDVLFDDVSCCVVLCRAVQIKRTEGVSTTDIVGRMLTCTRVNPHMTKEVDSQVSRGMSSLRFAHASQLHACMPCSALCTGLTKSQQSL